MINRAIYDQLIKKEILLVEDILTPVQETTFLTVGDRVQTWHELNQESGHSRFPVVDDNMKVQGMVTSKDIIGQEEMTLIDKVMTKNPMTVGDKMSVASSAHMMVWEGMS